MLSVLLLFLRIILPFLNGCVSLEILNDFPHFCKINHLNLLGRMGNSIIQIILKHKYVFPLIFSYIIVSCQSTDL